MGSRPTLTNNEIKDIMKLIRSLEIDMFYSMKLLEKLLVKNEGFLGH